MSIIKELKPAEQRDLSVYGPYTPPALKSTLPLGLSLYKKGYLEGERKIESGDNISFVATWNVTTLPSDLNRCQVQFDNNAELSYEVVINSSELINYLSELIVNHNRSGMIDFPQQFYRKLLRVEDQAQV